MTVHITIDEFAKTDLRVGTIIQAEPAEGADKLLILQVDLNEPEPRQIVAGLREHCAVDALVGSQVVVAANLRPAKIRGIVSQGMVLAAVAPDRVCLIRPDENISNGTRVQ